MQKTAYVLRISDGISDVCSSDLDGWHGDTSRMFVAGKPSVLARRLIAATYEAMTAGIKAVRPGATLGDIGHAIEQVARRERFSIVAIGSTSCRERVCQ